jgi:four helix bundle protein
MVPYERLKAWQSCHRLALSVYAGSREFRRYLDISIGSLSELSYTLLLARDRTLLSTEQWTDLNRLRESAGGLVWLLYRSLRC